VRAQGCESRAGGAAQASAHCKRMVDSSLGDTLARVSRTEMEAVRSLFSSLPSNGKNPGVGNSRPRVPQCRLAWGAGALASNT
jgi:hypothetical protein